MLWLIAGVFTFSAATGFLLGTNNSSMLSAGLFAVVGAIVGVLGLIQKLYLERDNAGLGALSGPGIIGSLRQAPAETLTGDLLATHLEANATQRTVAFSKDLASSLGQLLLGIAIGVAIGFFIGLWARETYPELFKPKPPIPVPWPSNSIESMKSRPISVAVGFVALAERLREIGWNEEEIQRLYRPNKMTEQDEKFLTSAGEKWLARGASTFSGEKLTTDSKDAKNTPMPRPQIKGGSQ